PALPGAGPDDAGGALQPLPDQLLRLPAAGARGDGAALALRGRGAALVWRDPELPPVGGDVDPEQGGGVQERAAPGRGRPGAAARPLLPEGDPAGAPLHHRGGHLPRRPALVCRTTCAPPATS